MIFPNPTARKMMLALGGRLTETPCVPGAMPETDGKAIRRLVFDCNDFDETLPGPFEWDLKRLAASIVVAGREWELGKRRRRGAVLTTVAGYREAMRRFASLGELDVWYARIDVESAIAGFRSKVKKVRFEQIERNLAKARSKDSRRALQKLTEDRDGGLRVVVAPPLI